MLHRIPLVTPHAPLHPTLNRLLTESDLLRDALHDLAAYPDVTSQAVCRRARLIGMAGEALVDSILLRHGLLPSPLPDGASADRMIPLARRSLRLQIKTRTRASARGFAFRMQKGYRGSPGGCRAYDADDFDIAALVALPLNIVRFTAERGPSLFLSLKDVASLRLDPLASLDRALADLLANERASAEPDLVL